MTPPEPSQTSASNDSPTSAPGSKPRSLESGELGRIAELEHEGGDEDQVDLPHGKPDRAPICGSLRTSKTRRGRERNETSRQTASCLPTLQPFLILDNNAAAAQCRLPPQCHCSKTTLHTNARFHNKENMAKIRRNLEPECELAVF